MAAYIIGLRRSAPRGTAWVKEYLPKTAALVAKHGGKALIGGNSTPRLLALEGAEQPPLAVVILEFPSLERARAWHDDPDYAPLKQLRQANVDLEVFVVDLDPAARAAMAPFLDERFCPLEQFTNRRFSAAGPFTSLFQAAGIHDFAGAARHVLILPYGRIADRKKLWLVLAEGRGSCTTKHALLAELAREQGIDVQLTLGIYDERAEYTGRGTGAERLRTGIHPGGALLPTLRRCTDRRYGSAGWG